MERVLAYMLGPKAENVDLIRRMVVDALDDHLYWRRNFYPQDLPVATSAAQSSPDYTRFVERLRDKLFEMLSEAKRGVPFFSARYLGHMNSDLLLPGLIGYFAAMLYNQNNVAGESSPVTSRLESEAVDLLLDMVGIDRKKGFGYLCTGGTAANLYGLWIARNLKTYPLSLRLALHKGGKTIDHQKVIRVAETHGKRLAGGSASTLVKQVVEVLTRRLTLETTRGPVPLVKASLWELLNAPLANLSGLRVNAALTLKEVDEDADFCRALVDLIGEDWSIRKLGDAGLRKECKSLSVGRKKGLLDLPWSVFVPANSHYSWDKILDLLGIGRDSCVRVPCTPSSEADVSELNRMLTAELKKPQRLPLAVVSTFGTTEQGALDDLPAIRKALDAAAKKGATYWWHVDAAYGGYLASMFRPEGGGAESQPIGKPEVPGSFKAWLWNCCESLGVQTGETGERARISNLIELSESGSGWLSWEELRHRTLALPQADSLALDPHKLGYVPYPAGAALLRRKEDREAVSSDAPYLWADKEDEAGFVGRYTVEGSRAGAAAAGVWLAHTTVPLDQSGHGRVIALSILSARQLFLSLRDHFSKSSVQPGIAFIHRPHSHILCYVPLHPDARTSTQLELLIRSVREGLAPTNEVRPFMVVGTDMTVDVHVNQAFEPGNRSLLEKHLQAKRTIELPVVRSVVMSPYALNARTRVKNSPPKLILELFAENLETTIKDSMAKVTNRMFGEAATRWVRKMHVMYMDDDSSVFRELIASIPLLRGPQFDRPQFCESAEAALAAVRDHAVLLDVTFLDIDMRPSGEKDSGYRVFTEILERNRNVSRKCSVKAVIFFTSVGAEEAHHKRVRELQAREAAPVPLLTTTVDKLDIGDGAPDERRQSAVRRITMLLQQIKDLE